jgi:hypothetical protein
MIAAAMRLCEQTLIDDALGDDAAAVLPEAIRLVLLRVRVPRYQRDMLVALARRHGVSVDEIVTSELEDVACAHTEELSPAVPSLAIGLGTGSDGGAGPSTPARATPMLEAPHGRGDGGAERTSATDRIPITVAAAKKMWGFFESGATAAGLVSTDGSPRRAGITPRAGGLRS